MWRKRVKEETRGRDEDSSSDTLITSGRRTCNGKEYHMGSEIYKEDRIF